MIKAKRVRKTVDTYCTFCGENNKAVLDVHRIQHGCDGGQYNTSNTVVACSNCHRKIHDNQIQIDQWYQSTTGPLLHCWIDGNEQYLSARCWKH